MNIFKPKKDDKLGIFRHGVAVGKEAERERIIGWLMSHAVELSYITDKGGNMLLDYRTADHNADELRKILGEEQ